MAYKLATDDPQQLVELVITLVGIDAQRDYDREPDGPAQDFLNGVEECLAAMLSNDEVPAHEVLRQRARN